ncbi:MAG: Blue-light-activated protein [Candidatus Hydrogenedentes bacterium ADurb.Bin179]|nr:MAG: Blue-light-activated protein [Candidatus Hydrogenedentes bacterium ADurb.Bin179]
MTKRQQLARYLEQEREALLPVLTAALDGVPQDGLGDLVEDWLNNQIELLRNKPCPLPEWAARFTEYYRSRNLSAAEAFTCMERLRNALAEGCQSKIDGVSDLDILSSLSESAARCAQALFAHVDGSSSRQADMQRHYHQDILESVKLPMAILGADGTLETANPSFCRFLKTNVEALKGRTILDLCTEAAPESLRAFLNNERVQEGSFSFNGEFRCGPKPLHARITCHPLLESDGSRAGAVLALEEKAGKGAKADFAFPYIEERLLPLIPLATQVVDGEGNVTFSSEQVASLPVNGYEGAEPLCCFLYHHRHGENSECPCKGVLTFGQFYLGEICYDSQMEIKWFRLLLAPVPDDEGRIARVFCCVHDMTLRKQVQKQLESRVIEQQRSSLAAQISITVAHQLRNPLSVVLGFAEMMSKGLAPEQYAEAVSRILRNSLRCKDIVESLLDFGKGMPLERRRVDFEVLIRESVQTMLTPFQNRRVSWNFSGNPVPIECVPEQMTQVVLSLLQNALHAAESEVICTLENKGGLIRLRVVDDGPGIPLDLRERVFEPFYTTRREEGATGLGLSLARAAVADCGGSLTVCAPLPGEPRGACLVLQLPAAKQKAQDSETAGAPSPATHERRLLIVDDESDMQDFLRTSLYRHGFLADTVGTGMEALEKLKQTAYDAVVLDYKIEGVLSCSQLYAEIADQYAHLIPHIMFLTGDMLNYQARVFIKDTGRPYLEKPFRIKDFLAKLNRLLG